MLDCDEYIRACIKHLSSTRKNSDGSETPYYRKEEAEALDEAKAEILDVLKAALKNNEITREEFEAMDPSDKCAGKFYALFKVHKLLDPVRAAQLGRAPPERPIISGSGSITENLSLFVDHHIRQLARAHPSFLEDTPDLLRQLDQLDGIPDDAILVTADISAMYQNIDRLDGLAAVRRALDTREESDTAAPTELLVKLLDLVLRHNLFEFDGQLYRQLTGTAMGTRAAPSLANIFCAEIDAEITERAKKHASDKDNTENTDISPILLFKRFLDDILMI